MPGIGNVAALRRHPSFESLKIEIPQRIDSLENSSCDSDGSDDAEAEIKPEQLRKMVMHTFAGVMEQQESSLQRLTPRSRSHRMSTLKAADTPSLMLLANLTHEKRLVHQKSFVVFNTLFLKKC